MGRFSAEEAEAGVGWGKDLNWISTNPSFSWDGASVSPEAGRLPFISRNALTSVTLLLEKQRDSPESSALQIAALTSSFLAGPEIFVSFFLSVLLHTRTFGFCSC